MIYHFRRDGFGVPRHWHSSDAKEDCLLTGLSNMAVRGPSSLIGKESACCHIQYCDLLRPRHVDTAITCAHVSYVCIHS